MATTVSSLTLDHPSAAAYRDTTATDPSLKWETMENNVGLGKKRAQWTRDRGNAMQKFIPLLSGKTLSCSQPAHSIFFMGNAMTVQFNSAKKIIDTCVAVTFFVPYCAVCTHIDLFLLFAFAPQNCAFHVCSFVHCELPHDFLEYYLYPGI